MKIKIVSLISLIALLISTGANADDTGSSGSTDKTLSRMVADLRSGVEAMASDIEDAAKELSKIELTGDEARRLLLDLCTRYKAFAVDCAAIDRNGVMVTIEPGPYGRYEGADISMQDITREVNRTKKLTMSDIFFTVEKIPAVSFQGPVFAAKGEMKGQISILFKPDLFIRDLIKKAVSWSIYEAWVMQTDGKFLYSPDAQQNGHNIFTNPYNKYLTEFVALGKRITVEQEGQGRYRYLGPGQSGSRAKQCTWRTLDLYESDWRVVLVEKL